MPAVIFHPCLIPLAAPSLFCINKTVDAQTQILLKEVAEKICKGMLEGSELQHYVVFWASWKCTALCSTVVPAPAQLWLLRPFFQASLLGHTASNLCHTENPHFHVNIAQGGKQPRDGEGEAHNVSDLS